MNYQDTDMRSSLSNGGHERSQRHNDRDQEDVMNRLRSCALCGAESQIRCGVCKVRYCSFECQQDHWQFHRKDCVPIPPAEDIPRADEHARMRSRRLISKMETPPPLRKPVAISNDYSRGDNGASPSKISTQISAKDNTQLLSVLDPFKAGDSVQFQPSECDPSSGGFMAIVVDEMTLMRVSYLLSEMCKKTKAAGRTLKSSELQIGPVVYCNPKKQDSYRRAFVTAIKNESCEIILTDYGSRLKLEDVRKETFLPQVDELKKYRSCGVFFEPVGKLPLPDTDSHLGAKLISKHTICDNLTDFWRVAVTFEGAKLPLEYRVHPWYKLDLVAAQFVVPGVSLLPIKIQREESFPEKKKSVAVETEPTQFDRNEIKTSPKSSERVLVQQEVEVDPKVQVATEQSCVVGEQPIVAAEAAIKADVEPKRVFETFPGTPKCRNHNLAKLDLNQGDKVKVVDVDNTANHLIVGIDDEKVLNFIKQSIEKAASTPFTSKPEVGEILCCKWTGECGDGNFYRCVVDAVNKVMTKVRVSFIDIGNKKSEEPVSSLRSLPEDLHNIRRMSGHVTLVDVPEKSMDIEDLAEILLDFESLTVLDSQVSDGSIRVRLANDSGEILNDVLRKSLTDEEGDKNPLTTSDLAAISLNVGDSVVFADIGDTSDRLIVLSCQHENTVDKIQAILNGNAPKTPLKRSPQLDEVVVCKWSEDGEYYRAAIKNLMYDKAEVFFIDYGNGSVEPFSNLSAFPAELAAPEYPRVAVEVSLDSVPSKNMKEEKSLEEYLKGLFTAELKSPLVVKAVIPGYVGKVFKMESSNGKAVNDEFVKAIQPHDSKTDSPRLTTNSVTSRRNAILEKLKSM